MTHFRHSMRQKPVRTVFAGTLATLAALLVALVSGCASSPVDYYSLGDSLNPPAGGPVSPQEVQIYVTQKPAEYEELGMLTYGTNTWVPDETTVYQEFRRKAAELGANGVILLPPTEKYEYRASPRLSRYDRTEMTRTTFRGVAIRTP